MQSQRDRSRVPDPQVLAWRERCLRAVGLDAPLARSVALDGRIDLHALLELVDRGCPAALAVRILAPLEPDTP